MAQFGQTRGISLALSAQILKSLKEAVSVYMAITIPYSLHRSRKLTIKFSKSGIV